MASRETAGGFHFYNMFQNCRWKFFLRYVMGLAPSKGDPKLMFGIAIHAAVAAFLTGGDPRRTFEEVTDAHRGEYPTEESWVYDKNRGPILVGRWVSEVGEGILSDYHVLAVEQEENPTLPNGFRVSLRADAILSPRYSHAKDRPSVYILETKTTGWGRQLVEESLQNSDQVSTYIWGVAKCHPEWDVVGVIPNVMYQNQSKVGCGLGELIFRTRRDLNEFELQTMGILTEISSKVKAVEYGWDPIALFDRNSSWCTSYNKPCEYMSVCRNWNSKGVPPGYKKMGWEEEDAIRAIEPERLKEDANEKSHDRCSDGGSRHVSDGRQLELDLQHPC